jgi:hypothetical protein
MVASARYIEGPQPAGVAMPEKNGDACGAAKFREETSKKADSAV